MPILVSRRSSLIHVTIRSVRASEGEGQKVYKVGKGTGPGMDLAVGELEFALSEGQFGNM